MGLADLVWCGPHLLHALRRSISNRAVIFTTCALVHRSAAYGLRVLSAELLTAPSSPNTCDVYAPSVYALSQQNTVLCRTNSLK